MPTPSKVAVTIIVPTYRPGEAIKHVFDSLDAQTMPAEQFEVIFVDDGSPDDTVQRLDAYAATHANSRVLRIENSGWPSRPRNTGLDAARGEYVLFMDHDDSLFPDALRRGYEFAVENGSDMVSPKESKTNGPWFGMRNLADGNLVDVRSHGGIRRLQPLVPHKLYRRELLQTHGIRFPEGRRILWEDWYVNVLAYRHSAVVSILADTPFYLWHASDTNATNTFDPAQADYWDRLEDLFKHVIATLDGADFAEDRAFLTAYTLYYWVIGGLARLLVRTEPEELAAEDAEATEATEAGRQLALTRSRLLLAQYGTTELLDRAPRRHQALAQAMRTGTLEQVAALAGFDRGLRATMTVDALRWEAGHLKLEVTTTWWAEDPDTAAFRLVDGGLRLDVGADLAQLVDPELFDLGDELTRLTTNLAVRDRFGHVTWDVTFETQPPFAQTGEDGLVSVIQRGAAVIDIGTAACAAPLTDAVWDLRFHSEWYGIVRGGRVSFVGAPVPAAVDNRAAIVYANKWRALTLDVGQQLRTLALDAGPRLGQLGPISAFSTLLTTADLCGNGRIPANLVALPSDTDPQLSLEEPAARYPFEAEIVVDGDSARLRGSGALAPGDYRLHARTRDGLKPTRYGLTVNPAGGAQLLISSG